MFLSEQNLRIVAPKYSKLKKKKKRKENKKKYSKLKKKKEKKKKYSKLNGMLISVDTYLFRLHWVFVAAQGASCGEQGLLSG